MKPKFIISIILIVILGWFVYLGISKKPTTPIPFPSSTPTETNEAVIVSTIPDPLNETIIPADQVIEITFNKPLQNIPEFKVKIEPKVDFKVELSSDRKTAKITFIKPLGLGASYVLSIDPDTKFDGINRWGQNKEFRFRTITYRGV